uniref:Transmembrane protein 53 n=1 Tax=Takifugu rubripes TaxID=31033 RepID=A0A674P7E6_TAKRU
MAQGEIDYNIVFPDRRHWQKTKEPVVILLGWAGCKDKHLSKYSSIYNEQLLELLYDYEVENSPVLFHVFSNGGFMLYLWLLCVIGAVVDSAPASRNVRGAMRALNATLGPDVSPVLRSALLALFAVSVLVLRNHYDAVRERPPGWPHLHLYSTADQVIRHRDIETFVDALKQKGVPVESFDFVSTPHVGHFRKFPEQYALNCRNFLAACVKDSEGSEMKRRRVQDQ